MNTQHFPKTSKPKPKHDFYWIIQPQIGNPFRPPHSTREGQKWKEKERKKWNYLNSFLTFWDSPKLAVAERRLSRRKSKETDGGSMENEEDEQNKGGWRRTMKEKGNPRVSFRRWTLLCGGRKLAVAGGEKIGAWEREGGGGRRVWEWGRGGGRVWRRREGVFMLGFDAKLRFFPFVFNLFTFPF